MINLAFVATVGLVCRPVVHSRHPSVRAQYSAETTRGLENLNDGQRKAFLNIFNSDMFSTPELLTADSEEWDRVRAAEPALAELSDDELKATLTNYVNTGPTLTDVLFKTPVGPVFAINILLAVTGLSYCDLPFVDSGSTACLQLAARQAAGS